MAKPKAPTKAKKGIGEKQRVLNGLKHREEERQARAAKPKRAKPATGGTQLDVEDAVEAAGGKAGTPPPLDKPLPKGKLRNEQLEEAWRGWPALERFGLYFHKADGDEFVCYHKFNACYAARKFIEAAAGGAELRMLPNGDLSAGRYVVRSPNVERYGDAAKVCASMQEVYDHKYTPLEAAWVLPIPYDGYAASLAGVKHPLQQRMEERMAAAGVDPAVVTAKGVKPVREPRVPRIAGSGSKDGIAVIKDGMPYSTKVRITAKRLSLEATGSKDNWKQYKAQAEAEAKSKGWKP